jgi:hypothetical protein
MKKMMKIKICLVCILAFASFGFSQATKITYKDYYNQRFEYTVSYPVGILFPQDIAANGDGRKFLSKDNRTRMLVYGRENNQKQTLSQVFREIIRDNNRIITYKILKNNWFVISGYENDNVFYQKTIFRNEEFMTFEIEYPQDQKKAFDLIAATISKSFR